MLPASESQAGQDVVPLYERDVPSKRRVPGQSEHTAGMAARVERAARKAY